MKDKNVEVKSISELIFEKNCYFIPSYQRGYKWDENNVKALLDDIKEFLNKEDELFYCMQPIIIMKKDDKLRVLDGQQRLTTFYILCKFLNRKITKLDIQATIEYETRTKSKKFLENIVDESKQENVDNIDFHYMKEAYNAMDKWFNDQNNKDMEERITTLLQNDKKEKHIGCIWYEVKDDESNENDIFARVNSGKIPLTDAELIKASVLNSKNFNSAMTTQIEIANEWDNIEYDLQDDEIFGFLVQNDKKYTNKIELLFEIYYNIKYNIELKNEKNNKDNNDERKIFNGIYEVLKTDNANKIIEFWKNIKEIYLTLNSWFNNQELYHLIGFLLAIGKDISEIYKECQKNPKDEFKGWCKEQIRELFGKKIEEDIKKLSYDSDKKKVQNVLLLFNIITYQTSKQKFSFAKYKEEKWSLEHIHPQNLDPQDIKGKNKNKWIAEALKSMKKNNMEQYGKLSNYITEKLDCKQDEIIENINIDYEHFSEMVKIVMGDEEKKTNHSIGNLALLSCGNNSALSNNIFLVKRDNIKEMDKKGKFIPLCTKNVFMKYYSNEVDNIIEWTQEDCENYQKEIINTIKKFFDINKGENNDK